jgi:hypothetical protein
MSTALYKQVAGDPTTTSGSYVNIEGLNFTLPHATPGFNAALVTVNIPQPYADGGTSNGIQYQIDVNGASKANGMWTNQTSQNGRSPFTMVALVPLTSATQFVQAQWLAVRNGTAHLGGSASMSALLVDAQA